MVAIAFPAVLGKQERAGGRGKGEGRRDMASRVFNESSLAAVVQLHSPPLPTRQPAPPDSSNERAGPSRNRSMASVPSTSSAASGGGEEQHSDLGLVMNALAEMQAHMRRQDAAQRRLESKLETLLMRGGGGDD